MEEIFNKLVLDWSLDDASQDGYIHTRSFPLSLGKEKEFSDIKNKKTPIILLAGKNNEYAIVAISREKYPGEINSVRKSSKKSFVLKNILERYPWLSEKEIVGFSFLYRDLLGIAKSSKEKTLLIRKGVRIQLIKTEEDQVYKVVLVDDGLQRWRNYREGEYLSREKVESVERSKIKSAFRLSLKELSKRITNKKQTRTKIKIYVEQYNRNPDIVVFALKRSKGSCELCQKPSPFEKENGEFYLEVHHLVPLSEKGEDSIINVAALCPNCHRLLHHGKNRIRIRKDLISKIKSKNEKYLLSKKQNL